MIFRKPVSVIFYFVSGRQHAGKLPGPKFPFSNLNLLLLDKVEIKTGTDSCVILLKLKQ
jgi:hypothetical protein